MQLDSSFFWMPREGGTMHRFWLQNYNATQKLTRARGDSCVLPCSSPVRGSTKTERHHTFQGRESFLSWLFDGMHLFKPVRRQCVIFLFVLFERRSINSPWFLFFITCARRTLQRHGERIEGLWTGYFYSSLAGCVWPKSDKTERFLADYKHHRQVLQQIVITHRQSWHHRYPKLMSGNRCLTEIL